jgi:hypothetical protein
LNKIYHHYKKWEDWKNGMYATTPPRKEKIDASRKLLSDQAEFEAGARKMIGEWRFSSEENLSDTSRNRRAWVGQATCSHAHGAAEIETKLAWWQTVKETQDSANETARKVIDSWEKKQTEGRQLCLSLIWG